MQHLTYNLCEETRVIIFRFNTLENMEKLFGFCSIEPTLLKLYLWSLELVSFLLQTPI